jgi:hypothetical protein
MFTYWHHLTEILMLKKLRGTLAIAAVIALFATGPEVAQVWSQAANVSDQPYGRITTHPPALQKLIVNKATPLFGG